MFVSKDGKGWYQVATPSWFTENIYGGVYG